MLQICTGPCADIPETQYAVKHHQQTPAHICLVLRMPNTADPFWSCKHSRPLLDRGSQSNLAVKFLRYESKRNWGRSRWGEDKRHPWPAVKAFFVLLWMQFFFLTLREYTGHARYGRWTIKVTAIAHTPMSPYWYGKVHIWGRPPAAEALTCFWRGSRFASTLR